MLKKNDYSLLEKMTFFLRKDFFSKKDTLAVKKIALLGKNSVPLQIAKFEITKQKSIKKSVQDVKSFTIAI